MDRDVRIVGLVVAFVTFGPIADGLDSIIMNRLTRIVSSFIRFLTLGTIAY